MLTLELVDGTAIHMRAQAADTIVGVMARHVTQLLRMAARAGESARAQTFDGVGAVVDTPSSTHHDGKRDDPTGLRESPVTGTSEVVPVPVDELHIAADGSASRTTTNVAIRAQQRERRLGGSRCGVSGQ